MTTHDTTPVPAAAAANALMRWNSPEDARQAIVEAVQKLETDLTAFCRVLASAFNQYPELRDWTRDTYPQLRSRLAAIEEVGRGELPESFLLMDNGKLSRLRRLSSGEQRDLATGARVEVLGADGTARKLRLDEMDDETFHLVIGDKGVRTLAEQRSMLDRKAAAAAAREVPPEPVPFHMEGRTFVADRPFKMNRDQLLKLILG